MANETDYKKEAEHQQLLAMMLLHGANKQPYAELRATLHNEYLPGKLDSYPPTLKKDGYLIKQVPRTQL